MPLFYRARQSQLKTKEGKKQWHLTLLKNYAFYLYSESIAFEKPTGKETLAPASGVTW